LPVGAAGGLSFTGKSGVVFAAIAGPVTPG
jgi:hypothetical protein